MALFAFAALVVIVAGAVLWGTAAIALLQSQQEQTMETTEETGPNSGRAITETGETPGWAITPAHMRMW
jgi:hypothetical protein